MITPEEARDIANYMEETGSKGAAETLRDLANQVEALKADAERYRWLREECSNLRAELGFPFCAAGVYSDNGEFSHNELLGFEQMDKAIDKARAAL